MNFPAPRLDRKQTQTLTPRLQHAVRLLQLSSLDFAQEVHNALGKNPFLEQDDTADDDDTPLDLAHEADAPRADADDHLSEANEPPDLADVPDVPDVPDGSDDGDWERDSWQQLPGASSGSGSSDGSDGETSAADRLVADLGLRPHLHRQTQLVPLGARARLLVEALVESLDDDGYLRIDHTEFASMLALDPPVRESEWDDALQIVQSLEPSGVGARTVGECLSLQLGDIDDADERELARAIIEHHLTKLAQHDVPGIARALRMTTAQVDKACKRIRRFDPRPGWRHGTPESDYIVPDIVVRKVRGVWTASLNSAVVPRVRLNRIYADLFQRHRDAGHAEMAGQLQEARWTVRNVEQRFSTILAVAQSILKRQHHFLDFGPLAMKPLGLREIADEVGLHESTVSRVTNNKYMATPAGTFELKYFFSRAMTTASGGSCSATAIRGVITDLLNAEDASSPLSDADITRLLARQGLTVARRTVTKYRQQLKIQPVDRRRQHV